MKINLRVNNDSLKSKGQAHTLLCQFRCTVKIYVFVTAGEETCKVYTENIYMALWGPQFGPLRARRPRPDPVATRNETAPHKVPNSAPREPSVCQQTQEPIIVGEHKKEKQKGPAHT